MNRRALLIGGLTQMGLLSGCGGGGNNESIPTTRGQFYTFRFTLTTSKRSFAAGENVPLIFTMKNVGSETLTVATPKESKQAADFEVRASVRDVRGEVIVWESYSEDYPDGRRSRQNKPGDFSNDGCGVEDAPCYEYARLLDFAPGQSRQNTIVWRQNVNRPDGDQGQAFPSLYQITVSANVGFGDKNGQIGYMGVDPLEITIR